MKPELFPASKRYKFELLVLLWLAYFFNQADRQIFSTVLPLIKKDLNLTDTQLGLIASALVWTYGLLVPLAGFAGDRWSKKKIIGMSLLVWSGATLFTGFCSTLVQFILLRGVATGGGEAFYAPAANALISEEHKEKKGLALSVHQTAVYFGIILSGLLAGYIADAYGWRNAFYLFGGLGILVSALIFLRLRETRTAEAGESVGVAEVMKIMSTRPTVYMLTAAFGCMVFVNVGYLTWMPTLLVDKFGLSLAEAGFSSMFYHHFGAFLGVVIGGPVADRLSKVNPSYRMLVQAMALLLGAPFIYLIGQSGTVAGTYVTLFAFGIFRGIYDSNIFASLFEVIKPSMRSSASGLMLMCAFLVGASGPLVLGSLKSIYSLSDSFSSLWLVYFAGSLCLFAGAGFFFSKDRFQERPDHVMD